MKYLQKFKNASPALKASMAFTICSILQKALSFITMPLFTRLLTTEQYGQFSIYSSWQAIISIFITLNLAYGSFAPAMTKYESDRRGYVSSIQSLVLVITVFFLLIYLPFNSFFNSIFSLPFEIVLLMIGEVLFQFSILCWYSINRYEFKYKGVIIITLCITVLSPLLSLLLIYNTAEKGFARICGYALINLIFGLVIFIINMIKGKKFFVKKYWIYSLKFNLPLIIYYLSQIIFNQSDKIMIEKMIGLEEAGIYSVAYSLALVLTVVLNAINASYVPWLYGKIKDNNHEKNKKMSLIITILMCTLVGGLIWVSPEIVYIMAGPEYSDAVWIIPPVAISLILLLFSQFFINIEFYYESRFKLVISSIGAALINIGLNYLLLPKFGYIVAGYTTLLSYFIFCICNFLSIRKVISKKGKLNGILNIPLLALLFIGFVVLSSIGIALYNFIIVRYVIIFIVILTLAIFHKKILLLVKKLC